MAPCVVTFIHPLNIFLFQYRRRQEAASKARSLNLKIKISQVSKSPKKSIILEENLSNDASSTSGLTNNNTTTSITGNIPIPSFNIIIFDICLSSYRRFGLILKFYYYFSYELKKQKQYTSSNKHYISISQWNRL